MAWQYVPDSKFKKTITYKSGYGGTIYLYLMYDDSTATATTLDVKWEISCGGQGSTSGNSWNHYFLLIYPDDSSKRQLYVIKNSWTENTKGKYPWRGPSFRITKTAAAKSFSLPPYWLINDGYDNTANDATKMYNRYKPGGDRAAIASGNLVNRYGAESISGFGGVYSSIKVGKCTVSDNYNNTFNVKGEYGTEGSNNPITSHKLWWAQTYSNNNWNWSDKWAGSVANITNGQVRQNIPLRTGSDSSAKIKVIGSVEAFETVSCTSDREHRHELGIMNFVKPSFQNTVVTLTKQKTRLTIREPWTFTWYAAKPANGSSPVKGYELCIERTRNGTKTELTNLVLNSAKTEIVSGTNSSSYINYSGTATAGAAMSVSIDPKALGFKAKDIINFWVRPYTQMGKTNTGTKLYGNWIALTSGATTIQSAGVINVYKTNSSNFVEGIACVYKNGNWVEAESVQVYSGGNWKESV